MRNMHRERHLISRIGWLRAAILGANDGILSTSSIILGVASAHASQSAVLLSGVAGLVAGAMSMAAGEYVSVSSQSDTEKADLARERAELESDPQGEALELTNIYVDRGLSPTLAIQVAQQLMAKDALGTHARDELGISIATAARPAQAALTSALTFTVGAAMPLLAAWLSPQNLLTLTVSVASLIFLAVLGAIGSRTGGSNIWVGVARVGFWGAVAMAVTAGVGAAFGTVV
jgi:VIT1/CCC1 family predicted Fe2+/Mn2+ transporter